MEIILSIIVFILSLFSFPVLSELIVAIVSELICEFFSRFIINTLFWQNTVKLSERKPIRPWQAILGYFVLGSLVGGVSLLILPFHFIKLPWLAIASLIMIPILAGFSMMAFGAIRRKIGNEIILLNTFSYGFCFALTIALVRFFFCS